MAYKSLLAIHSLQDSLKSLQPAVTMARSLGAHLEILVLNLASPIPTLAFVQNPDFDWSDSYMDILGETRQRVKEVTRYVKDEHISVNVISSCQQLGMIDDDVSEPALYADLVLFRHGDSSLISGMMAKAIEGAVFDAAKPALILADNAAGARVEFKTISIAWDPVPEAMKAISSSLPLLDGAELVEVVVVAERDDIEVQEGKTAGITQWLARHGVSVEVKIVVRDGRFVSHALVDHINAAKPDLVIMGAYGHTRLSERLFAGVTHQALDKIETSLFIAH